jgi:hypothetical protein
LGSWAEVKGQLSGLPTFIMILTGHLSAWNAIGKPSGHSLKSSMPVVNEAGIALGAADTVTSACPSASSSVALPQPTTAGMPSSRAMMAAWQVRPPRLVTMALKPAS